LNSVNCRQSPFIVHSQWMKKITSQTVCSWWCSFVTLTVLFLCLKTLTVYNYPPSSSVGSHVLIPRNLSVLSSTKIIK
jgi:hypothetical protein